MLCRQARHRFFEALRPEAGDPRASADHADDQAETFLFNLRRGAVPGLGGMAPVTGRPGHGVSPAAGRAAGAGARVRRSAWPGMAGGPQNTSREHTRNRLRHDVLPTPARRPWGATSGGSFGGPPSCSGGG